MTAIYAGLLFPLIVIQTMMELALKGSLNVTLLISISKVYFQSFIKIVSGVISVCSCILVALLRLFAQIFLVPPTP